MKKLYLYSLIFAILMFIPLSYASQCVTDRDCLSIFEECKYFSCKSKINAETIGLYFGLFLIIMGIIYTILHPKQLTKGIYTCKKCGSNLRIWEKFCPKCGAKTKIVGFWSKCKKCGTRLRINASFCQKCGKKV